ncbi:hypothetical protein ACFL0Z_00605 [Patescibacteria group bacterium]
MSLEQQWQKCQGILLGIVLLYGLFAEGLHILEALNLGLAKFNSRDYSPLFAERYLTELLYTVGIYLGLGVLLLLSFWPGFIRRKA